MKNLKFKAMALSMLALPCILAADSISGKVFCDTNGNGKIDDGEKGIAGVVVSDGFTVTATAQDGSFKIDKAKPDSIVWICRPSDYVPVNSFWRKNEGKTMEFALRPEKQERDFVFAVFGDPHVPGLPGYGKAVALMIQNFNKLPVKCAFAFAVGDLAEDADSKTPEKGLAQFETFRSGMSGINCPLYVAPGNHDHALTNSRDGLKLKGTPDYDLGPYNRLFGPAYYSFDYGDVHFIVLDGTVPHHTRPGYRERISDDQLRWMREDLARQPEDKTLVIFCHETMAKAMNGEFTSDLGIYNAPLIAGRLKDRKVAGVFSGHVHNNYVLKNSGFPAPNFVAAASTCEHWRSQNCDGTPRGTLLAHFRNGKIDVAYAALNTARPATIAAPASAYDARSAKEVFSGKAKLRWIIPGKVPAAQQSMTFDGKSYSGTMVKEYPHWSLWEAEVDTFLGNDGVIPARFSGGPVTLFTVANGKDDANFKPLTDCKLRFNSSGAKIPLEFYWNGELLKKLDPVKPGAMTEIPLPSVKRMNKLEIRVPEEVKSGKSAYRRFRIARPKGADIHDLRIDWNTVTLDAANPESRIRTLYFGIAK